jgi:5-(carboxyamino)imidazole ribonucleotide synthase
MNLNPRIGILGGGQLALMLAQAAKSLGSDCIFLDPSADAVAQKAGVLRTGSYNSENLRKLKAETDVITFEFENIPTQELETIEQHLSPATSALKVSQDRFLEKTFLNELGIETAKFQKIDDFDELKSATTKISFPAVLKTRRLGYDGKGQIWIHDKDSIYNPEIKNLLQVPCILEEKVRFLEEVSVIGARSKSGEVALYPLTKNSHKDGILIHSEIRLNQEKLNLYQESAHTFFQKISHSFNYVGVLTIECFLSENRLMVNEIAPRVHNSGHWTIEGCECSQFENHIRAILDLPLGSTKLKAPFVQMFNIIGSVPNNLVSDKSKEIFVHIYGKDARPGRKLGHVTCLSSSSKDANLVYAFINQLLTLSRA